MQQRSLPQSSQPCCRSSAKCKHRYRPEKQVLTIETSDPKPSCFLLPLRQSSAVDPETRIDPGQRGARQLSCTDSTTGTLRVQTQLHAEPVSTARSPRALHLHRLKDSLYLSTNNLEQSVVHRRASGGHIQVTHNFCRKR